MQKKYVLIIIGLAALISLILVTKEITKSKERVTLYSWKSSAWEEKKEHLFEIIEERKITDLYQDFTAAFLKEKNDSFIKELNEKNVDVFYLTGDPEWGRTTDAKDIIKEIDKVVEFNNSVKNKIKGIVFDVEPYQDLEDGEFKESMLKTYKEAMEKGYTYAKEKGLMYIICIPSWYDKVNPSLLKEIIKNADRIELMNYAIKDSIENIKTEMSYAKELKKEITNIYQVNFNYNIDEDKERDGIFYSYREMHNNFKKIQKKYNYEKLWIGYHYFDKM